jgi:hypothetical protein
MRGFSPIKYSELLNDERSDDINPRSNAIKNWYSPLQRASKVFHEKVLRKFSSSKMQKISSNQRIQSKSSNNMQNDFVINKRKESGDFKPMSSITETNNLQFYCWSNVSTYAFTESKQANKPNK